MEAGSEWTSSPNGAVVVPQRWQRELSMVGPSLDWASSPDGAVVDPHHRLGASSIGGTEGLELAPAIEAYLVYCRKARRLSHHTCSAYGTDLRAFQAIAGGELVDRQAITAALEKIIENPAHKSGTIARRMVAVHGFLNWQDEVLAHQVFSRLKFKMVQPKRLPKTIPERELRLLFAGSRRVIEVETPLMLRPHPRADTRPDPNRCR
jgi:hypothetical protein